MLDDKICKLREELNNSIVTGKDYSITYGLSIALDDLIAEYYKIQLENKSRSNIRKAKVNKKLICY